MCHQATIRSEILLQRTNGLLKYNNNNFWSIINYEQKANKLHCCEKIEGENLIIKKKEVRMAQSNEKERKMKTPVRHLAS